jgi:DnaJ-class molecular chaperone
MAKDYYSILGVPRGADEKEIKAAYRKLARKYHPDVNPGDKAAENRFKEVSQAWNVLGDPERKKMYDQYGSHWESVQSRGANPGEPGVDDFGGFQGGGFETIFEQFFGGFGRTGSVDFDQFQTGQPKDVEKIVEVSLEEIDEGSKRTLTYQTMDASRTRDGITTIPTTKKVEVKIPAGISDGKKLRVPGKGQAGINGKAGDLYVVVRWASHPRFKPSGDNLEVEVPIDFVTAALGGEIKVPTLRSSVKMRVPAGTQSGQSFRLANQGLSRLNGGRTDLIARAKILVPKNLSEKQRQLLLQLRDTMEVPA